MSMGLIYRISLPYRLESTNIALIWHPAGKGGGEIVSGKERWIMAAIIGAGALYFFKLDALYLFAVAAVIYFISRSR